MPRLLASRLGRILTTALIAALAFAAGAAVVAHAASTTLIYACVKGDGDLRIVQPGDTCKSNESMLSWNQQGPAGPQGPQGPAGGSGSNGTGTVSGFFSPDSARPVNVSISGTAIAATVDNTTGYFKLDNVPVGVFWTLDVLVQYDGFTESGAQYTFVCTTQIPGVRLAQAGQTVELPGYRPRPQTCSAILPR